jgi:hypothetical protein
VKREKEGFLVFVLQTLVSPFYFAGDYKIRSLYEGGKREPFRQWFKHSVSAFISHAV